MTDKSRHQADDDIRFFEELYAEAQGDADVIPWSHSKPHPLLVSWLNSRVNRPSGRALVVGCGLGDDAEELARRGWAVAAFDASQTAISWCRRRFPTASVEYRVADLFALPANWHHAFDLVVENRTIQSLPPARHPAAIAAIAETVAPGGEVVAIAHGRGASEPAPERPWPLGRRELADFAANGLVEHAFHEDRSRGRHGPRLFRAVYRRPR